MPRLDRDTLRAPKKSTLGVIKRLGTKGMVRADIVRIVSSVTSTRSESTPQTGQVQEPGRQLLGFSLSSRTPTLGIGVYDGLHTQFSYRFNRRHADRGKLVVVARSWRLRRRDRRARCALPSDTRRIPRAEGLCERHTNRGPLLLDQRHKVSLWGIYSPLVGERHNLSVSVLQRFGSGRPFVGSRADRARPGGQLSNFVDLDALGYLESDPTVDYWFFDRGDFKTDDITSTDIAINYSFGWALGNREFEVFVQPEILNVFNEDGAFFVDATVLDATSSSQFQTFNPFTDAPVEGVHFGKGPNFGQPTSAEDFQTPRTFRFSVGFRF